MTPANLLTDWAWLLIESLADAGITDIVISPGSRSTPVVWAAVTSGRLRCHSVVDERSAAFFAVGRGKVTGRPAALLCTSGSAVANYFPAVVEAALSATPLLVLTADRPFALQDCGASQTIDQLKLFGAYARTYVELGAPAGSTAALAALRRRAAQAVFATTHPDPGPVHLNVRADKPLEPLEPTDEAGAELRARCRSLAAIPITRPYAPRLAPDPQAVEQLAEACRRAGRGLVVCGPMTIAHAVSARSLARFVERTGFAVYAEATSQLRFALPAKRSDAPLVDALDGLLRAPRFRTLPHPDFVLHLGAPPTSSAWERLASRAPDMERHVVAACGWPDPQGSAASLVIADPDLALDSLCEALADHTTSPLAQAWTQSLMTANAAAWSAVETELRVDPDAPLTEGAAVRDVVDSLPAGSLLAVGNSLPVREVDTFCPSRAADVQVWSQRGASGIDGVVSGAAGAAAAAGRPTTLLIGDVSFLHDLGGLAVMRELEVPCTIAVLNNDGGRIFEQLPLGAAVSANPEMSLHPWVTPHGLDFEHAAALFGIPYRRVATGRELKAALAAAGCQPGCTVVEARLPPHGAREQHERLWARIDAALAEVPLG